MSTPNVISGQAIGTDIAVFDETALAALSIQGLALGSTVYVTSEDVYFKLVISSAALSPGHVVAVNGIDGLRWLLAGSGGGGGGGSVNTAQQYVSPLGNDNNDGLTWASPKKTGWAAFVSLQDNHGGTMYLADGCTWVDNNNLLAGQVANQGAWFFGSGADSGPGFQLATWPTVIIGVGSGSSEGLPTPFQQPGTAMLFGGSNLPADGRTKPCIWKVQCLEGPTFYNIQTAPYHGAEGGSGLRGRGATGDGNPDFRFRLRVGHFGSLRRTSAECAGSQTAVRGLLVRS